MDFVDTQLFGALIGGSIGVIGTTGVALVTQIYTSQRHKKQLAHEREQENISRRIAGLVDLSALLEHQQIALQTLWGFVSAPTPDLRIPWSGVLGSDPRHGLSQKFMAYQGFSSV